MRELREVLAAEVLGEYDNGGGDEWVETTSLDHVEAAVLAWLAERLDGAREAAWSAYRDGPDYTPTDRYPVRDVFDAALDAVRAALSAPQDAGGGEGLWARLVALEPRGLIASVAREVYAAGDASLVEALESAADDDLRTLSRLWWQREALVNRINEGAL